MATLSAFLHPVLPEDREIVISNRFVEDGEPVKFRIRAITQEESNALRRKCTVRVKGRTGDTTTFNSDRYQKELIVACTVFPDFRDAELCEAYGTRDPLEVPGKMLLAGEYLALGEAILDLSGLGDNASEEETEEAKNL